MSILFYMQIIIYFFVCVEYYNCIEQYHHVDNDNINSHIIYIHFHCPFGPIVFRKIMVSPKFIFLQISMIVPVLTLCARPTASALTCLVLSYAHRYRVCNQTSTCVLGMHNLFHTTIFTFSPNKKKALATILNI